MNVRRSWLWSLSALLLVFVIIAGAVCWRAGIALRWARKSEDAEDALKFTTRQLSPAGDNGFESVSAPEAFAAAVSFDRHLYVVRPVGLFEYDEQGRQLRDFRVGRELPPARMQCNA